MLVALMKPGIFQVGEEFVRVSSTRTHPPDVPASFESSPPSPAVRLTATGQPFPSRQVVVEFLSGPNVAVFDYTVACYPQDTVDCADVLGGEVVPIDSVGGPLPRSYSRVLTNLTVRH